jgi:conjugative transfer signal peptidase TraF
MMKLTAWTIWGLTAVIGLAGHIAASAGFMINHTASAPRGLWRIAPLNGPVERGRMVSVCPPDSSPFRLARKRGWLSYGRCPGGYEPLLKPVSAIPGDFVELTPEGLSVNGRLAPNTAPLAADSLGRPMPSAPFGAHVVRPGEAWLVSDFTPWSFDSRYFGPLPLARIEGAAAPVWISTATERSQIHGR